jgi:hypothetical protein
LAFPGLTAEARRAPSTPISNATVIFSSSTCDKICGNRFARSITRLCVRAAYVTNMR